MATFIELGLSNAVVAGGLAMVALIVTRCCKNPTLAHGLWALVILKLLTPPLWTLPVADVPVIDQTAQLVATGRLVKADEQDNSPASGVFANPVAGTWAFPLSSASEQNQPATFRLFSTRWSTHLPLGRPSAVGRWVTAQPQNNWLATSVLLSSPLLSSPKAAPSVRCVPAVWQPVWSASKPKALPLFDLDFTAHGKTLCWANNCRTTSFAPSRLLCLHLNTPIRTRSWSLISSRDYSLVSGNPFGRSVMSPTVTENLPHSLAVAGRSESASHVEAAPLSNPILPSTLKVTATDVEYWLSNSKDAIEFLAGEEQSSVPPAWEQPALEYVVLMTTEGNTLVVPGAELMQFQEHPLATTNPGVDPSTKGQPGELRTMLAQESPDSEWSVVWGTRLARLWSNCRAPLALLWGFGSLWCLGLAVIRIRRFHKVLAHTSPAPEKLIASARRLAKRIGLRRTPQVRLAPGVSNPLVWRGLRQSYIVLPAELLRQLSRQQAATLLTHELAHLRRKDHVMRWLELAATILYWWNPILWFARRQLRESEERCCDAWVVWAMPQAARDYLDTVLKTVDFLSTRKARLPLAATGMGHFQELQTRFEQVITNHQDRREHNRLSRFARCGLAIVALAMLPLVPTLTAQGIVQANVILQESHGASEVATGRNLHGQDITVELQSSAPSAAWSTALYSRASQLSPSVKNLPGVLATDADIEAVATSTDGRLLAVGRTSGDIEFYKNSAAGLVMIWSASTQDGHTHDDKVTSMAFSSDGHRLASAGRDGQVQVREAASGEIQESWQASESWLTDAAFSPRGDLLAVGGYDRTLQVFDLTQADGTTDAPRSVANGKHDSAVRALQFLPQNSQLATVDSAGNLSLWDLNERKQLALLHRVAAHHGVARDVAVNAIGNRLATVGEDGQLRLWAWKANELAEERSAESDDLLSHVAFGFDDRLLVSAGWSGNIHLHDGTTGEIINKVAADPGRPVRNLAINRDNILLAGGQSPGISLWGFDQPVATYYVPAKVQLQPIRFGVSTQYVAASSGETPTAPRPFVPGMDLSQTKSLAPKNVVVYFAQDEFSNSQSEARQSQLANDRASQTTSTKSSNEQFAPACDEPNPKP